MAAAVVAVADAERERERKNGTHAMNAGWLQKRLKCMLSSQDFLQSF